MRLVTPTLSICALAAAFTAGALTAAPPSTPHTAPAEVAATAAATGETVITISGMAFSAAIATPGTTVRIVNTDAVPHTVTADDGSFDVFVEADAEVTFVAPATPGSYSFFCAVHPSMTGTLLVT